MALYCQMALCSNFLQESVGANEGVQSASQFWLSASKTVPGRIGNTPAIGRRSRRLRIQQVPRHSTIDDLGNRLTSIFWRELDTSLTLRLGREQIPRKETPKFLGCWSIRSSLGDSNKCSATSLISRIGGAILVCDRGVESRQRDRCWAPWIGLRRLMNTTCRSRL